MKLSRKMLVIKKLKMQTKMLAIFRTKIDNNNAIQLTMEGWKNEMLMFLKQVCGTKRRSIENHRVLGLVTPLFAL